jgi:hypothetical protein
MMPPLPNEPAIAVVAVPPLFEVAPPLPPAPAGTPPVADMPAAPGEPPVPALASVPSPPLEHAETTTAATIEVASERGGKFQSKRRI